MEQLRNEYEEKLDSERALFAGSQRESESNVQALRNTMEQLQNDYEEKLDNERASNEGAKRESEANVQALRDTMERMRNSYEEKLDNELETLATKALLCSELEQLPENAEAAMVVELQDKINSFEISNKEFKHHSPKYLHT